MARDNHPRERQARTLARKAGRRPPYDRILIVTEGEKTEPQYFDEIRRLRRLSNAFIDILESQYGTEPRQIVDFAKDRFRNRAREFDRVFVVFDRDDHRSYHDALLTCQRAKLRNDASKPVELCAVASNPCFELWLLLHFEDVFELFHRREILGKLKRQMPDYEKALRGAFERTQTHLAAATARAERLQARFKPEADTEGPYTNVDVVVDLLLKMRGPD